jgi:hypothetical protein
LSCTLLALIRRGHVCNIGTKARQRMRQPGRRRRRRHMHPFASCLFLLALSLALSAHLVKVVGPDPRRWRLRERPLLLQTTRCHRAMLVRGCLLLRRRRRRRQGRVRVRAGHTAAAVAYANATAGKYDTATRVPAQGDCKPAFDTMRAAGSATPCASGCWHRIAASDEQALVLS